MENKDVQLKNFMQYCCMAIHILYSRSKVPGEERATGSKSTKGGKQERKQLDVQIAE